MANEPRLLSIKTILQKYISDKIPKKQTNILFQMFNGVEAMFLHLEYMLQINKRERNFLTAQHNASLRNLAANNGFEPKLKIPARGLLEINVNPQLFNRAGYPLFIPPYAVFKNPLTGITYYFNSEKTQKLDSSKIVIPVIEGELTTITAISSGNYLERIYLQTEDVAEGSIVVAVGVNQYQEVKSFFNNENVNDNRQFVVKFSNNSQTPIIVYVKGTKLNDVVSVTYRLTSGELGNIGEIALLETEDVIDGNGVVVDMDDEDLTIRTISGFSLGSNGTDINALKAAIGYNHGNILLFDDLTYRDFINKYSTILLQKIVTSNNNKIHNIFVSKRVSIPTASKTALPQIYRNNILSNSFVLSKSEKIALSESIEEFEYALSSSNLVDSTVNKFAVQILFETLANQQAYGDELDQIIYEQFSKFLFDKYHTVNFEIVFNDFMVARNIKFEYTIFNQEIEAEKLLKKTAVQTPYILKHENSLPILQGNFDICDLEFKPVRLFFDINQVTR